MEVRLNKLTTAHRCLQEHPKRDPNPKRVFDDTITASNRGSIPKSEMGFQERDNLNLNILPPEDPFTRKVFFWVLLLENKKNEYIEHFNCTAMQMWNEFYIFGFIVGDSLLQGFCLLVSMAGVSLDPTSMPSDHVMSTQPASCLVGVWQYRQLDDMHREDKIWTARVALDNILWAGLGQKTFILGQTFIPTPILWARSGSGCSWV